MRFQSLHLFILIFIFKRLKLEYNLLNTEHFILTIQVLGLWKDLPKCVISDLGLYDGHWESEPSYEDDVRAHVGTGHPWCCLNGTWGHHDGGC